MNQEESYIQGMHAFPLLELGRMEEDAAASRKGYEINKKDAWAHHCLCHVLEHECSVTCYKALLLSSRVADNIKTCIKISDNHIWKELEKDDAVLPEVYLNAIGLLLRLDVRDALKGSIGDRLKLLADRLTDQENWYMSWHLVTLIVWGLAKVGESSKFEFILSKMNKKKQQVMQKGALELLGSDFNAFGYKVIGASDEQIDVFNEMWCQLLLKTGQSKNEVIRERIKVRDGVPFMWRLLEKSYTMVGDAEAESAGERAKKLESSYF
ncbi:hypothetical protein DY000_02046407 [Brassica cretica]|uniref:Tetratricopeptide repeat protein 38 n=1 Tax=Brassica cretica TaxID=69181 RepID=A0ABQ7EM40_BRACR|nr:hypothetical protein DY000_02046407 [Brassica cretica]